jgi:CBS domain-containing protein
MNAKDIMTSPVVTVTPETSVREIAALLLELHISAVPVLEGGRLAGMVSEADLLHRHEIGTDRLPAGRWWPRFLSADRSPWDYVRSHARKASDIMTRDVVCAAEDTPLSEVANLFERHGIRRVPVMRGERLVGIVSRADLVRALAVKPDASAAPADDEGIRRRLLAELEREPWWRSAYVNVTVSEGVVHYWGATEDDDDRVAARVAAENVPGVRRVVDHRISFRDVPSMV